MDITYSRTSVKVINSMERATNCFPTRKKIQSWWKNRAARRWVYQLGLKQGVI